MLDTIVEQQVVFYFVGAAIAIGVAAKLTAGISLKRLVKAASNMGKSNHALMRLVRAKFEHACMVSDKVQNVRAFVDKYVYEYKTLGIRLHSWRQLQKSTIWICGLLAAIGAALTYYVEGMGRSVYQYGIVGTAGMLVLFLLHIMTDEHYQMEAAKTYMVDFLENTYAHRYVKANQKEIQVTVQKAAENEGGASSGGPYPEPQIQEVPTTPVMPVKEPNIQPEQNPVQEPSRHPMQDPQQQPLSHPGTGVVMGNAKGYRPENRGFGQAGGYPQGAGGYRAVQDVQSGGNFGQNSEMGGVQANYNQNADMRRAPGGYRQNTEMSNTSAEYGQNAKVRGASAEYSQNAEMRGAAAGYVQNAEVRVASAGYGQNAEVRVAKAGYGQNQEAWGTSGAYQHNPETRAASSGSVQSSGTPPNSGNYGQENTSGREGKEKTEMHKEARIREILEEFLA